MVSKTWCSFFHLKLLFKKNYYETWQIYDIQLYLHMLNLPVGQMVKTPPSQGGVTSSILVRVIILRYSQIGKAQDSGSWMFRFEPEYLNTLPSDRWSGGFIL